MFALFVGVFGALTYLYALPIDGVIYAILLCTSVILLCGIVDFLRYRKKHKLLLDIQQHAKDSVLNLPSERNVILKDYENLARTLGDELRKSETAHEASMQELRDFYAKWVHQIKTPISAMSLMLQESTEESDRILLAELLKISGYTEHVLGYLRLDDMSSDLMVNRCNLRDVVNSAVRKHSMFFIRANIKLVMDDSLDRRVLTDEKWLCFAIEQIISNAVKYTPPGGKVKIYTESKCTLVIVDSGQGISAQDLPRIFEKGFTGYNGRMDKKATGIGLYMTKKSLDRLGHNIKVFSNDNGTTVKIDLHREELTAE